MQPTLNFESGTLTNRATNLELENWNLKPETLTDRATNLEL